MRILIATTGSDGDTQPFFAYARHLLGLGHEVTFAGSGRYVARARALSVPFTNLGEPWDDDELRRRFATILAESVPLKQLALVIDALVEEELAWLPALVSLAREADVVIYPPLLVAAVAAARATNTRHVSVHFAPMHAARGYGPTGSNLGSWLNTLAWKLAAGMLRRSTDAKLNTIVRAAGLAPWKDILLEASHSPLLDLVAASPLVTPKDASWGPTTQVTGYWFLDEPEFSPSRELEEFVSSGEPPVVLGFGSMTGLPADAITKTMLEAVDGLSRRVIIQSGWAGLGRASLPGHVRTFGFVPHGWLFPRAACVVHHGGAGTTAAAFRAGVPQAVVWHLGDQPMWGGKVAELGVGPKCVFYRKMTAPWLRASVDTLLSDAGMRTRAAALGEKIRAENGPATATAALLAAMTALAIMALLLAGCAARPAATLSAQGSAVRVGKTRPPPGSRELGPVEGDSGGGCAGFGTIGTYEAAEAELRNRTAAMGGDYAEIVTVAPPHDTGDRCPDNRMIIRGVAFETGETAAVAPVAPAASTVPAAPPAPASTVCDPACAPGYACSAGSCVASCTPPCGPGQVCRADRVCVPGA